MDGPDKSCGRPRQRDLGHFRNGGVKKGLIRFDLPPEALGQRIYSAQLKAFIAYRSNAFAATLKLYRLTKAWDEITVSWSVPWTPPGGATSPLDVECDSHRVRAAERCEYLDHTKRDFSGPGLGRWSGE